MEKQELRQSMESRLLRLGELLKVSYGLINERFGSFLGLTLLVYIPVNVVLYVKMLQVDPTVEDAALMLNQAMSVSVVQLILVFIEIVAVLVTAVLVHNQVYGEQKIPFGTAFYRGIRMWVRAVTALVLVMLGAFLCLIPLGSLLALPGLFGMMLPLIALVSVYYSMMQNMVCCAAALRGHWGLHNLRYSFFILRGYMGRAFGRMLVISLITSGISMLFEQLLANIVSFLTQPWLYVLICTAFSALISVLNTFGFIAASVLFLNLEEIKIQEVREADRHSNGE